MKFAAAKNAWYDGARPRLCASMTIATALIGALIFLVTFADDDEAIAELEVFLLEPEQPVAVEPAIEDEPDPIVAEAIEEALVDPLQDVELPVEVDMPAPRDWYSQMEEIVRSDTVSDQRAYSVNPVFDEKRRKAALQFRPSRAPVAKPIWENVETDQMGRKILVSGDCHRVIDEPSAVRYEDFRTFHQYITFCSKFKRQPKELPWVDEIRDRHVYLQPDDVHDNSRTDLLAELQ